MRNFDDARIHRSFMLRALRLASNGGAALKLNPPVGCVIVHKNCIIGEGYHRAYGENHAEVNAIESVSAENRQYLPEATAYVTLEPCSHYGKTPPCSELLVHVGIKSIFIGCKDPNTKVSGRGITYLLKHGLKVTYPFMEEECLKMIKQFRTHITHRRPHVCLKWAQSQDGFMGRKNAQISISGQVSQFLVHQWRAQFQAILVGSGTVLIDNPQLDNRLMPGPSPDRIILDRRKRLMGTEKVFRKDDSRIFYCTITEKNPHLPDWVIQLVLTAENFVENMLSELYKYKIGNLFIEGGAEIHHNIINVGLWDEIRLLVNKRRLEKGIRAPQLQGRFSKKQQLENDTIYYFDAEVK